MPRLPKSAEEELKQFLHDTSHAIHVSGGSDIELEIHDSGTLWDAGALRQVADLLDRIAEERAGGMYVPPPNPKMRVSPGALDYSIGADHHDHPDKVAARVEEQKRWLEEVERRGIDPYTGALRDEDGAGGMCDKTSYSIDGPIYLPRPVYGAKTQSIGIEWVPHIIKVEIVVGPGSGQGSAAAARRTSPLDEAPQSPAQ